VSATSSNGGSGWGRSRVMNPLEAFMWRAEVDPRLRSTILALEVLDCAPDWQRFLDAHDWATRMVPRFRQRVVDGPLGLGQPEWIVDPEFDLSFHVRHVAVPEGEGWTWVLEAAQQLAMAAFDKARSPWEAVLYEGLPGGKAAYALKMHHSATDGIGGIQLLGGLHSRQRESDPGKPQPASPAPELPSLGRALVRQAGRDAGAIRRRLTGAGDLLGSVRRPDKALGDAARFGSSLRRVLSDPDAEQSPIMRERSLSWRFQAMDVAFKDLRAAGKAADGSINDAFLAALLGGFRIYHEEMGSPIERMPVAIPISVRREGDDEGGNKFAGARLALPVGVEDPVERMALIRKSVLAARGEAALDALAFVAPVLARLPGPVSAQLAGGLTKANDLQASNVPGIREDVYLAGAKIERLYPFAPLPGCAAMIALVTHGDTCCIGTNLDPAAITEPDRFARCLEEGFAEVLALAPEPAAPVLVR